MELQVAYTVRLNGLGKGSTEYIPAEEGKNLCVVCKALSLDEYGCFNHKAMKECIDCCGCEE